MALLPTTTNTDNLQESKKLPPLKGKQRLWLSNYLDINNPATFFNGTESAKCSNYQAKSNNGFATIGKENYKKLQPYIKQWLDEYGLSEDRLKLKLIQLTETQKTVFQKLKGHVDSSELPDNVTKIVETHKMEWAGKGENAEPFDDGETVLGIRVDDPECQRRALDMALKVKGLYNNNESSTIRPIFNINFFPGDPIGPAKGPIINIEPQDPEAKKAKD